MILPADVSVLIQTDPPNPVNHLITSRIKILDKSRIPSSLSKRGVQRLTSAA
nr:MAG TPA: hypothetical protein [Caudoviricetes sp.]